MKKLLLAACVLAPTLALGAVTITSTPPPCTSGYATTCAVTVSTTGPNQLIVVGVSLAGTAGTESNGTVSVSGSTLGTFTRIGSVTGVNAASEHSYVVIFAKYATAQVASETVTETSSTNQGVVMGAVVFSGALDIATATQGTAYAFQSATNTGTTASVPVTPIGSGGSYLFSAGWFYWTTATLDASTTQIASDNPYEHRWVARSTNPVTGATTVSATSASSRDWSLAVVEIPSSGSTSQAAAPTANPPAGTYSNTQSVTLSCAETSPTITYCTGAGCTPSTTYSAAISVSSSTTIGATCATAGKATSPVTYFAYTISATQAATPTFNPGPGTFTATQSVTLACTTPSSTIYYSTNGTSPTHSSSVYGGAISVPSTTTIQAICAASGLTDSPVASGTFTIGSVTDFYAQNCPSLWAAKTPLRVAPSGAQPTNYLSSTNVNDLQAALITLCQKLHTIETRVAALEAH